MDDIVSKNQRDFKTGFFDRHLLKFPHILNTIRIENCPHFSFQNIFFVLRTDRSAGLIHVTCEQIELSDLLFKRHQFQDGIDFKINRTFGRKFGNRFWSHDFFRSLGK